MPKMHTATESALFDRLFPNHEWALLILIAIEIFLFSLAGPRFLGASNAVEIIRLSVEIGLLALALTPIIITGGIDLSVGSMMGLSAILFGLLWRDLHLPIWLSAMITLGAGLASGGLNALLIARFRLPPLIVTLGSYSLFRGLAEGLTRGADRFSGFPPEFLFLGQGYIRGFFPPQMMILGIMAIFYFLLLHKTIIGRALYAIGFSEEGSHYAGIPVRARLALIYGLSGFSASLAALIYISHLGQAKSNAGTGYELTAITAVVLGGTSIFGGRGTIWGTIFGLFAIVILQNGLRLAAMPTELAGILTGLLLITTICIDRAFRWAGFASKQSTTVFDEEQKVKNSQVAILSAVILSAALIVAGSNWFLVRSIINGGASNGSVTMPSKRATIAMMPKAKGDPYFASCRKGAEEAARELSVDLIWDGPTELDPARQNEIVEAWITRGVDVIAVSVENREAISTVLQKAREKGIKVLTWDADSRKEARDFFINQATPQGIGATLTDEAARILQGKGEFALITGSLSAANQNEWIVHIKARLAEKYPDLKLVAIQPSDDDRDRAFAETQTVLKVHPNVKLIMGIAAPAVPGAAEAVKQSGRSDVKVIGLSIPNLCKPYVHAGIIESVVLWNTLDLGYLTVFAANELQAGKLTPASKQLNASKLGAIEIRETDILLGTPFIFNKSNIDRFDF